MVDEENLAFTQQLPADRLCDSALVVLADIGQYRAPFGRRSCDQGQVTQAGERHFQGPGYGGGGHRKDVYVRAQLLDHFLVGDAEALFLVDDEQPEILELDFASEQLVSSDHDVDRTVRQALCDSACLGGREEAGEHFDADGVICEALRKCLQVL